MWYKWIYIFTYIDEINIMFIYIDNIKIIFICNISHKNEEFNE